MRLLYNISRIGLGSEAYRGLRTMASEKDLGVLEPKLKAE